MYLSIVISSLEAVFVPLEISTLIEVRVKKWVLLDTVQVVVW